MRLKSLMVLVAECELEVDDAVYTEGVLCTEGIIGHPDPDGFVEKVAAAAQDDETYFEALGELHGCALMLSGRGVKSTVYALMARHGNEALVPVSGRVDV